MGIYDDGIRHIFLHKQDQTELAKRFERPLSIEQHEHFALRTFFLLLHIANLKANSIFFTRLKCTFGAD